MTGTLTTIPLAQYEHIIDLISMIGTLGSFGFLIVLFIKERKEKEIDFWHNHQTFLALGTACGIGSAVCNVKLDQEDGSYDNGQFIPSGNGFRYFSIVNIGNNTAFDVKVKITKEKECGCEIFSHYIPYIPQKSFYGNENISYIYSKNHIKPDSLEPIFKEFDICECIEQCEVTKASEKTDEMIKEVFVQLEYYASPFTENRTMLTSKFKVYIECKTKKIKNIIQIKGKAQSFIERISKFFK